MKFIDKAEDVSIAGASLIWRGVKKAPSAAWWALTKSPKLFRRGFQLAAVYFGSLAVEKALDAAHEEWPENQTVGKADTIIHEAVKAENFLLGGAAALAKSAYDAVPAKAAPAQQSADTSPPARTDNETSNPLPSIEPVTDAAKLETESVKEAKLALPAAPFANIDQSQTVSQPPTLPLAGEIAPRDAAFLPIESADRNRANLNTAIAMPAPTVPAPASLPPSAPPPVPAETIIIVEPAVPVPVQEILPIEGGYAPSIGIGIGPFGRPHAGPHPYFRSHFKP